jgi:hypothetical protein
VFIFAISYVTLEEVKLAVNLSPQERVVIRAVEARLHSLLPAWQLKVQRSGDSVIVFITDELNLAFLDWRFFILCVTKGKLLLCFSDELTGTMKETILSTILEQVSRMQNLTFSS